MMPESCPHERSAARAARSGRWSDELAAHLADCVSCRESSQVARLMDGLAEEVDSRLPPLPDARRVWLQARLLRRSRRSDRALLPIRIASVLAAIGSGAVLASLPGMDWNLSLEWLTNAITASSELPDLLLSLPLTALWVPAAIVAIFLLLVTASEA